MEEPRPSSSSRRTCTVLYCSLFTHVLYFLLPILPAQPALTPTDPRSHDTEFGIMCAPSKDTRRRRVCSQIKEEKEEKEKEGGKEEIVNGIYILIEWRFVNWSMLIYNIPLIFICFSTCYSIINLFT